MATPKAKTAAPAKGKVKLRKKEKKNVAVGKAFIKSTFLPQKQQLVAHRSTALRK
jgi:hypothetical protein